MEQERKYLADPNGRLNSDDASFALAPNEWVNAENVRTGTTDSGETGTMESVGSNVLISEPQPSAVFITLRAIEDTPNSRIIKFQYNTTGNDHKIVALYAQSQVEYNVLLSSQIEGGLNFSKYFPIDGRVVDSLLYWVDNNRQRKINIDAALNLNNPGFVIDVEAYTAPITQEVISLLKRPPLYPITFKKAVQPSITNNYIAGNAFQFMANYYYRDGETSVLSVYSTLCPYNLSTELFNRVDIFFPLNEFIDQDVQMVNLVVRYGDTNNFFVIRTWDKNNAQDAAAIANHNSGISPLYFGFYNSQVGEPLDEVYTSTPFYSVPILSRTLEIAQERLFLADNVNGYDTPTITSLDASFSSGTAEVTSVKGYLYTVQSNGVRTWYFQVTIYGTENGTYDGYYAYLTDPLALIPSSIAWTDLTFMGTTQVEVQNYLTTNGFPLGSSITFVPQAGYQPVSISGTPFSTTVNAFTIFKTDSSYKVGIVFYDFGDRKTGVVEYSGTEITTVIISPTTEASTSYFESDNTFRFPIGSYEQPLAGDILYITAGILPVGAYTVISSAISGTAYVLAINLFLGSNLLGSSSFSVSRPAIARGTVFTPDRQYITSSFMTALNWTLSNDNAINEIPVEAVKYSIVLTKCLRTREFLQARVKNVTYVTKDADGIYEFNTSAYAASLNGIGVDITLINGYGMGYAFTEGDLLKLYISVDVHVLRIIAQSGNWVVCQLQDIGAIGDTASPYTAALFEIFTPYQSSLNEPFYEQGNAYPILNAGTDERSYSTVVGALGGDTIVITRSDGTNNYYTENMSGNDTYWQNWYTNAGRINLIVSIGQTNEITQIAFSETYISGSKVNGFSNFDALNVGGVSKRCGAITKLFLTSKVSDEQGNVMLAICQLETNSVYIGETRIIDETGATQFFASSTGIIGTINVLKGSFGSINPESVTGYRGNVYWIDMYNGKLIQYSLNGLDVISNVKMTRFWNLWCKKFLSMSAEDIEALGGRPFVYTIVDKVHTELLISIPKLSNDPPKGYLPDYPDMIYPFDILDYQAKTVVYKLGSVGVLPHFQGAYTFYAENFVTLQNNLYSFKNGLTYLHNQTNSYNNFFGVQCKSSVAVVSNLSANVPKVYNNIGVEANMIPTFVYFYNNFPYQQSSDLIADDFNDLEGIYYATIYRNKLVPTVDGFTTDGLLTGEKMRGVTMFILFQFEVNQTPLELKFLNIGLDVSLGHTNQLKP